MEHIVSFFASSMKQRASKKSQGVPAGRFSEFANDRMSSCPPNLSVRPSNLCSRARSPSSPVSSCQSSASVSLPPSTASARCSLKASISDGRTDGSDSANTQLPRQTRRRQTRVRDMYTRTAQRKMGEGAGWRNDDPLIIFIFSETSGLFSQSSSFNVVKKVKRQSLPSLRSQP